MKRLLRRLLSSHTVFIYDPDFKRVIVHLARSLDDAIDWVRQYDGHLLQANIYHEGAFGRRLVATERDA